MSSVQTGAAHDSDVERLGKAGLGTQAGPADAIMVR